MRTRILFPHRDRACHASLAVLMLSGLALALLPGESWAAVFKCVDLTYSGSKCAENAEVLSFRSDQPVEQQGTLTLYLNAHRGFTVNGTINSHPVDFVVDTGASSTVISQRVATASGIRTCTGVGFHPLQMV